MQQGQASTDAAAQQVAQQAAADAEAPQAADAAAQQDAAQAPEPGGAEMVDDFPDFQSEAGRPSTSPQQSPSHGGLGGAYVRSTGRSVSPGPEDANRMPLLSELAPEDPLQAYAAGSAEMPKILRAKSKKAAMDARVASLRQEDWLKILERGRQWYRRKNQLQRQDECETEVDEDTAEPPWRNSANTEGRSRAKMEEQRRRWAPLSAAQSHDGGRAFSRMTDALEPAAIEALRMDLCYLCSMHGRELPSHMKVQDPPDDPCWELLMAAHVMVRDEEEPKVGGCWLWSNSEPRVGGSSWWSQAHLPELTAPGSPLPVLTAPARSRHRAHGSGLMATAPGSQPRAHPGSRSSAHPGPSPGHTVVGSRSWAHGRGLTPGPWAHGRGQAPGPPGSRSS